MTSSAVEWVPRSWQADADSVEDVARAGAALLSNPEAGQEGREALAAFVRDGTERWLRYLDTNPT